MSNAEKISEDYIIPHVQGKTCAICGGTAVEWVQLASARKCTTIYVCAEHGHGIRWVHVAYVNQKLFTREQLEQWLNASESHGHGA